MFKGLKNGLDGLMRVIASLGESSDQFVDDDLEQEIELLEGIRSNVQPEGTIIFVKIYKT